MDVIKQASNAKVTIESNSPENKQGNHETLNDAIPDIDLQDGSVPHSGITQEFDEVQKTN